MVRFHHSSCLDIQTGTLLSASSIAKTLRYRSWVRFEAGVSHGLCLLPYSDRPLLYSASRQSSPMPHQTRWLEFTQQPKLHSLHVPETLITNGERLFTNPSAAFVPSSRRWTRMIWPGSTTFAGVPSSSRPWCRVPMCVYT
jgi:hypothetical protein